jgi:hypothetical protein
MAVLTGATAPPSTGLRIECTTELDPALVPAFLALYRESFAPLEILSAARQSLTDDEFLEEMAHPAVVKWVGYVDEQPVALMFFSKDLSILPWISVPYFAHYFPDHYGRGAIYYFGGLLVQPEHRGGRVIKAMLEAGTRQIAADDAIAAFDCCAFNVAEIRLPEMIAKIAGRLCDLTTHDIDTQHYYPYELRNLR